MTRLINPVDGTGAVPLAAKAGGLTAAVAPVIQELRPARYRPALALVDALLLKTGEK